MANTYTQIHIQFVMAVKYRHALISKSWQSNLYKYITGIVQNKSHKMLAINGTADHIHILIGFRPTESIAQFMQDVKAYSSKWINEQKLMPGKFAWQSGYGAFSYSKSQLPDVINYIAQQEEHHHKKTFRDEYLELLTSFEVDYENKYIFQDLEN